MPKKAVVVGLGGTGDWVVTFLKSRLYLAYGEADVKRDVQFLLVDTIHAKTRESAFGSEDKKFQVQSIMDQHEEEVAHLGRVRVEQHEYLPLTGEIHHIAESIRRGADAHTQHLKWFSADFYLRSLPAAAMNITDGAGQWRQFGRMGLTLSAERGEFTGRVDRLIRNANLPAGDGLTFYLVSSLAGGTGAGTFLDAAALIRNVATKAGIKVWIAGFLVLPSAFIRVLGENTMRATVTRSFAAFRELTRFQTLTGQGVPFAIPYSLNHTVDVTTRLFDTVFVFDALTEWKNLADVSPQSAINPSIADCLEVFLDRSAGSAILEDLINAAARMAGQVRLDQTLPPQFHSMGSYKIVLPARQYASAFASRFALDFLQQVFPSAEEGGIERLLRSDHTDDEYRDFALRFIRKIPNLFTEIADMLGDVAESFNKLKGLSTRPLDEYRFFLRPKQTHQGVDLQMLTLDPIKEVQIGKVVGDSAEDAAKRIVLDCDRRLGRYWEKLSSVMQAVLEQLDKEIAGEVRQQVREILNRRLEDYREYPVGTALAFLNQIVLLCDDLSTKVLEATESAIDAQRSGQNSLGHWQTQISLAQASMEATRGSDGFFSRARAYDAQNAYLRVQAGYLERRRLAEVFKTYRAITETLKTRAAELVSQVEEWTDTATFSDQFSARRYAESDITEIETALIRAGETFTSSYGLVAYEQGKKVDPSMGGYRERLYERFARPLLDNWLESLEWELETSSDADPGDGGQLTLRIPNTDLTLEASSGRELYQSIYDAVRPGLETPVTSLSIFDYFIDVGFTPKQVGDFLKENCGPMIGALMPVFGADPRRQVYLVGQQPEKKQAVDFLNDLQRHLKGSFDRESFQGGPELDFDNPHTLTLLYLVQDIRQGQIQVINDYEQEYNQQLTVGDAYVVNHVFACEQEATRIEKEYLREGGHEGAGDWKRIHPRVVRLLDRPERLRLYLRLWALGIVRLEPDPADPDVEVWMLLTPGVEPGDDRVVWLTAPGGHERTGAGSSPLLAIERFCLVGRSAKPDGAIKIDLRRLADLVDAAEKGAGETGEPGLRSTYERFLDDRLEEGLDKCRQVHSELEAEDLRLVAEYYLLGSILGSTTREPGPGATDSPFVRRQRAPARGREPHDREQADALEKEARAFLLEGRFGQARSRLEAAFSKDPEREPRLRLELGFLDGLQDEPSEDARWCYQIWKVLARDSDFRFDRPKATAVAAEQPSEATAPREDLQARSTEDSGARPEEKGETLEIALLELFSEIFQFTDDQQALILKSLRQQRRGTQFGHDLSFECQLRSNREVRCHVECKNYKNAVSLEQISAKLLQEKTYWGDVRLDYWILVSPHADPKNELSLMLKRWEAEQEFPFGVQFWTPETRVREFFGLHPPAYEQIYGASDDDPAHPSRWCPEHRARVLEHWIGLLEPRPRVPREWLSYFKTPSKLCMRTEDPGELDELFRSHVPLGCKDAAGIFMSRTLEENTRAWLRRPDEESLLVLGDFGDGKTVFTYVLARKLVEEFLIKPSEGWIPLRIPLGDLAREKSARNLLRRRLEELGATLESWNSLRHSHQVLAILDGFDEISIVLDRATVTRNIRRLLECRDELSGLKLLITSRTRFFDNRRDQERLLERLGRTQVLRIAPISRSMTVEHLQAHAAAPEDRQKFQVLRGLYDPVGLAEKPLFLGMIKETLRELPETHFNQAVLYETYVDKSLRRKIEGIEDAELQVSRARLLPNLKQILEWAAMELFHPHRDYVLLSEFPGEGENGLAGLLWRLSSREGLPSAELAPTAEEDARARVGIRSLLKARRGPDPELWPVDFFHRSMREYFLARAIARSLREGTESAARVLRRMPLPHEVVDFVVELIQREEGHELGRRIESCEASLAKLARLQEAGETDGSLGGNALTILYRAAGEVPGEDWANLALDSVNLVGAELSGKSFRGSSLRGANLDNANLERADFRDADLTGVRIERTAAVTSLAAGTIGGRIVAGYGDGSVREWVIRSADRVTSRLLVEKMDGAVTSLTHAPRGRLCATLGEDFVLFGEGRERGSPWVRFPARPDIATFRVAADCLTAMVGLRGGRVVTQVELNELTPAPPVEIEETAIFEPAGERCLVYSRGREELVVEETGAEDERQVRLKVNEPSSVAICRAGKPGEYLVGCGQRDGRVRLWRVEPLANAGTVQEVFAAPLHEGVVTALAFLNRETVLSGGHDRTIRVARIQGAGDGRDGSTRALSLRLNLRCQGMLIDGVQGKAEYRMLRRLMEGGDVEIA